MKLIHYGSSSFDYSKWRDVSDRHWNKPNGGLWTSPVDSTYGWIDWCLRENFAPVNGLSEYFIINFTGKLYCIDNEDDMRNLAWIEPLPGFHGLCFPLWEPLIHLGYDAVHLTVRGERLTRLTMPKNLYGWDCETVLILNKNCIR